MVVVDGDRGDRGGNSSLAEREARRERVKRWKERGRGKQEVV